jgi:hypothetical protein
MAVRLSQERLRLVGGDDAPKDDVAELPSVRRLAALSTPPESGAKQAEPDLQVVASADDLGGDDDEDDECEAVPDSEDEVLVDEDEYYADVWESR